MKGLDPFSDPFSVKEAKKIIADLVLPLNRTEKTPIGKICNRVLAEDVRIDTDIPPFDRCNMDGYALIASEGEGEFEMLELVAAGFVPKQKVEKGKVIKVMTGAPLPNGADAVIPVEKTKKMENGRVRLEGRVQPGENVTPKGLELKKGDLILEKGTLLRPQEISMLASAGCANPLLYAFPSVAVLPTGTELLEPDESPATGKIRNSNAYGLLAQCHAMGLKTSYLGIVPDEPDQLREKVRKGLEHDVLLLTGGVSMGDFDIVPDILGEFGVKFHFKRVKIKPGKPVHFGTTPDGKVVFGLPGNPVSTMVIFEQFVKTALNLLMRYPSTDSIREKGVLKSEYRRSKTVREEYIPVFVERGDNGFMIHLIHYLGSGHMMALTKANALIKVDSGIAELSQGSVCDFQWL